MNKEKKLTDILHHISLLNRYYDKGDIDKFTYSIIRNDIKREYSLAKGEYTYFYALERNRIARTN